MRIQHNINALNSHRQLGFNNINSGKNLEKLSSGYRINRAGDDAAGLAISEKMRGQIRGLDMASKNAQDGISLIQTAEGALNETHSILQRMRELAVQSSNGIYDNEVDRANLDKEVNALKSELDRISTATDFNGIKLLDGSQAAGANDLGSAVGGITTTDAIKGQAATTATAGKLEFSLAVGDVTAGDVLKIGNTSITFVDSSTAGAGEVALKNAAGTAAISATDFRAAVVAKLGTANGTVTPATGAGTAYTITAAAGVSIEDPIVYGDLRLPTMTNTPATEAKDAVAAKNATVSYKIDQSMLAVGDMLKIGNAEFQLVENAGDAVEAGKTALVLGADQDAFNTNLQTALANHAGSEYDNIAINAATGEITFEARDPDMLADDLKTAVAATVTKMGEAPAEAGITFQIGANGAADQRVTLNMGDMSATGLAIDDISIGKQDQANTAIGAIDTAINTVSGTRADLGALQNRLEHTVNNLNVNSENLTAAESRIRDVDMAKEMMDFTKNNILTQAAQAMLAQANQQPQGVLQLLR